MITPTSIPGPAWRALSAVIAGVIACIPALLDPRWDAYRDPLYSSPLVPSLIGGAIVTPLGWILGPDALGTRRDAARSLVAMASLSVVAGGWAWTLLRVFEGSVEGTLSPIDIVPTVVGMAAFGMVVLVWAFLAFLTLPSALAWIVILRSIRWVAARASEAPR